MIYLTRDDVALVSEAATGFPLLVRDEGLLASALARPSAAFGGHDAYPDIWHKAAALIESVARNHSLVDGNKRTAWASCVFFLKINGTKIRVADTDRAEVFILDVATGRYDGDVPKIASDLQNLLAS